MSNFVLPRAPKPPRPLDIGPRPLRPLGTVWIRKHHRYDRFKGWVSITGHWRRSEPRKPKNPAERMVDAVYALEQGEQDCFFLLYEMRSALDAYLAWDPQGTRLLHERNDVAGATDQPDALLRACVVVRTVMLKAAVANIDDSGLLDAGLQRRDSAAPT